MFGLIKTLVMMALIFLLIGLGLAYLPPDTQSKVTSEAASLAVKGCRGGKMLYEAFKAKIEEEGIGSEDGDDSDSVAVADEE